MGAKAFLFHQAGDETTPGTAVAATEAMLGRISFKEDYDLHQPEHDRNSLALYFEDSEFVGKRTALTWEGDLNPRHAVWALGMSVRGNITATQPDPTNEPLSYLWTYEPGLTTANTPDIVNGIDTNTWEFGDDDQCYEANYCFSTRLQISGAPNAACQFACDIVGSEQSDVTKTAALSYTTGVGVQLFPFNLATIAIDADGGTMGDTASAGLLRGFTWTLNTQFSAYPCADGDISYANVVEGRKFVELDLIYKWDAAADAEKAFWEAQTTRLVRIALNGSTEQDAAQSNPPYLHLSQAIRYTDWPTWGDDAGHSTVAVKAVSVYDSGYAKLFEVALKNMLAAYP